MSKMKIWLDSLEEQLARYPQASDWEDRFGSAFFSVSRALWGVATRELRGVILLVEPNAISVRFIYEREPTEEELEDISAAETEVAADVWDAVQAVEFSTEVLPAANSLPDKLDLGIWIYRRKETLKSEPH